MTSANVKKKAAETKHYPNFTLRFGPDFWAFLYLAVPPSVSPLFHPSLRQVPAPMTHHNPMPDHCAYQCQPASDLKMLISAFVRSPFFSALTLKRSTFPLASCIADSMRGVSALHGLHQLKKITEMEIPMEIDCTRLSKQNKIDLRCRKVDDNCAAGRFNTLFEFFGTFDVIDLI